MTIAKRCISGAVTIGRHVSARNWLPVVKYVVVLLYAPFSFDISG